MTANSLPIFVASMGTLLDSGPSQVVILQQARTLLANLIKDSDWLAPAFKVARPDRYAQYLLHKDPQNRFSVVSFVWDSGQATPIHNHTVWGLVGVLEGAELCEEYTLVNGHPAPTDRRHVMQAGDIEAVFPPDNDWHKVSNALTKGVTVSIHVYGANIGEVRRNKLELDGRLGTFVSGYDVTADLHD